MWVKRPIKISYKDLHAIFGKGTKALRSFKQDFTRSIKEALPYLKNIDVDFESDKKHIILSNEEHKVYSQFSKSHSSLAIEEGIFGELRSFGVPKQRIEEIAKNNEKDRIQKAITVTKKSLTKGKVKNPAGFFTKALIEGWDLPEGTSEGEEPVKELSMDLEYEKNIDDEDWRLVRSQFAQMKGIATFKSWIKDLVLEERGGDFIKIKANTRFISEYVQKNFLKELTVLWNHQDSNIKKVEVLY